MITIKIDNTKKKEKEKYIDIILDGESYDVLTEYINLIEYKEIIINSIGKDILEKTKGEK